MSTATPETKSLPVTATAAKPSRKKKVKKDEPSVDPTVPTTTAMPDPHVAGIEKTKQKPVVKAITAVTVPVMTAMLETSLMQAVTHCNALKSKAKACRARPMCSDEIFAEYGQHIIDTTDGIIAVLRVVKTISDIINRSTLTEKLDTGQFTESTLQTLQSLTQNAMERLSVDCLTMGKLDFATRPIPVEEVAKQRAKQEENVFNADVDAITSGLSGVLKHIWILFASLISLAQVGVDTTLPSGKKVAAEPPTPGPAAASTAQAVPRPTAE
jgi:hypothetical protein